jgi:general stress protein 26
MHIDLIEKGSIDQVRELIADMKYALLTKRNADGSIYSRPLTTLDWEFDGVAWFLVPRSSRVGMELREPCEVNVAYASPDDHTFVSLCGRGRVFHDSERAGELWNLWAAAFFPRGPTDPDVGVLRVDVGSAEYWMDPHNLLDSLPLRALMAKDPAGLAHHARIDLSH